MGSQSMSDLNTITFANLNNLNVFNYAAGATQTLVVPAGVTSYTVHMWGAGGGGSDATAVGGAGAYVTGVFAVTPGETLSIIIGFGGASNATAGTATQGGGGASGGFGSGSGGGRTAIRRGGVDVVVAGGGGGSGWRSGGFSTFSGTAANGLTPSGDPNRPGKGGSQIAGGAAGVGSGYGNATPGTAGTGGNGASYGGGGGGGWFGGGGGGTSAGDASGGGGGSSYTANLTSVSGQNGGWDGVYSTAPGQTVSYWYNPIAFGGNSGTRGTNNGGNGLVVFVSAVAGLRNVGSITTDNIDPSLPNLNITATLGRIRLLGPSEIHYSVTVFAAGTTTATPAANQYGGLYVIPSGVNFGTFNFPSLSNSVANNGMAFYFVNNSGGTRTVTCANTTLGAVNVANGAMMIIVWTGTAYIRAQ
jgi:hypothetical protein